MTIRGELGTRNAPSQIIDAVEAADTNIVAAISAGETVDSAKYDAFGRQRVSNPDNRLDVEFLYDKQDDLFDEVLNGASASVTHNANTRDLTLTVGSTTNGEYAKMSSFPVPYTPGSSQLIDMTGVLDFAGIGGGTAEVFLRSSISGSPVDLTTVTQASWDNATTGVDWTDSHIFSIDFQSLKVGRIRFALVQNGLAVPVAEIVNDNLRNSGYWQIPNLPVTYRIYNTATETIMEMAYGNEDNAIGFRYRIAANATATMKAICCTVKSEGGGKLYELAGLPRTADMGTTKTTVSTTLIPLISIRPKTTFQGLDNLILSFPKAISIDTDNPIRWVVLHDCTLTGASWTDVDTAQSCIEYDVSATAVTNGHEIAADYIRTSSKNAGISGTGLLGKSLMWNKLSTETGIFTIAAVRTTTTDAAVLAAINWEELR